MLDELVRDHLSRIQTELDKYRKFPLQTTDNKLEMHLELSNARYRNAYENIKALKKYTESSNQSIQTTNEVDRKNDLESFMKIMLIQQFQQQNALYQTALLNTLTKEERAQYVTNYLPYGNMTSSDIEREKKLLALESGNAGKRNRSLKNSYKFENNENTSKLRIFGYIHLFAMIIKQAMIQPPFRLSNEANFELMLRYSVDYLVDNLKDINSDLGKKLSSMNMKTAYQFYLLIDTNKSDNKQQKTIKLELQDMLDSVLIEITEKLLDKPLFAVNKNSTIYKMLKKDKIYPKNYFITIEKLFLGFELGSSSGSMTTNRISINNKLLGSICTYIYRKTLADIINERTRTTDLPVPVELQNLIFNDTEMKEIYGLLGRKYLTNSVAKCKRWLQDYGKAIMDL
ncbi:unnamed protein product [Schistosoma turkestanicum]|nr:unnamed protein product [Schistosoma turkestanicum]